MRLEVEPRKDRFTRAASDVTGSGRQLRFDKRDDERGAPPLTPPVTKLDQPRKVPRYPRTLINPRQILDPNRTPLDRAQRRALK